jgi:hypothetical protein
MHFALAHFATIPSYHPVFFQFLASKMTFAVHVVKNAAIRSYHPKPIEILMCELYEKKNRSLSKENSIKIKQKFLF